MTFEHVFLVDVRCSSSSMWLLLLPQSSRKKNDQEQCRETKGAPRLSLAQAEEPEKAASFTVLDGLKGCEVALTAMDRRVTNLEDCLEDIGSDLAWWLR